MRIQYPIAFAFQLLSLTCLSQQTSQSSVWSNIELALRSKKSLEVTRSRLIQLKEDAIKNNDPANIARAYCYMMLLNDQKTEDTFYFRNSVFIDSILQSNADTTLKGIMHHLQAQRLWKFKTKNWVFNRVKYEVSGLRVNYAAFSMKEMDSLINYHFEKARSIAIHLNKNNKEPSLEKIRWLSSTPLVFLFKPSFADIVFQEQVNYNRSRFISFFNNNRSREWVGVSQDAFIDTIHLLSQNKEKEIKVLSVYRSWLEYASKRPAVYYSIELLARLFVYNELEDDTNLHLLKDWEGYLQSLSASAFPEVKARAVYTLCFLYKKWANKYLSQLGYDSRIIKPYDSTFQYCGVKALELYGKNKALFDRYGYLKEQLGSLQEILEPSLMIKMDNENEPEKCILINLEYKNVPKLYYRIVSLNHKEIPDSNFIRECRLLNRRSIRECVIPLPLPADHNLHRTFLKLDPLPAGRYCLLFSHDSLFEANRVSYLPFHISGLTVLHTDDRVYVVNRTSGMPVQNAKIDASYVLEKKKDKTTIKDTIHKFYTTNGSGYFILPKEEDYNLLVSHNGDSLITSASVEKREVDDDVFNKKDYDDLIDYYDDNTTVEIFTDRAIYRPGQKVFFKALFIVKNPKTGEDQIMNKANLKRGFRNWLKRWYKEMEPELYLIDPFGRDIDTVKINPDEFGTVSGTFTIPSNAATGEWEIKPDYRERGHNSGYFQVEEYKRPTFEISINKPERTFHIGDTILFAVKLRSFSGGSLSKTAIKYTIERTYTSKLSYYENDYPESIDIASTTAYTDEQGQLLIKILDTSHYTVDRKKDIVFTYRLNAMATDETGESHGATSMLKVATRPVMIRIPTYGPLRKDELKPLLMQTTDVNDLEINRALHAKLYRVSTPDKIYEKDYSGYADQWVYDANKLESLFGAKFIPSNDLENEELIFETTINTAKAEKFRWPLEKITTGKYRIEVTSSEDGILTGETVRSIDIFEQASVRLPANKNFFFHVAANYLRKDDTLSLFSGTNFEKAYSTIQLKYYLIKNGKKIIVNRFFEGVKQKGIHEWRWKLPENIVDRLLITEILVVGGKLYRDEEAIDIAVDYAKPLIIIEQFRSTLIPGAETTYAVSIKTRDQNTAAQLMTTIYDASLDKLKDHYWRIPYPERSPSLNSDWTRKISYEIYKLASSPLELKPQNNSYLKPLWWMDVTGLTGAATSVRSENPLLQLQGRVPGLLITNAMGLDESVLNEEEGVTTRRFSTGNIVRVRIQGISSMNLAQYKQPLIILDGAPYTGELSALNIKEVTDIMILKDADAIAIYGTRGAGGVLIISTKGEIRLPVVKQEPVLKVRSNFNETAFFAPAIYADKDGFYRFTFTVPESLTEWNWKLFAHTRKMMFAGSERKLVTRLPLMVQPQMPTILYQGDRIVLKSRIANLDTVNITGKAICKIEDAVTGQDLTAGIVIVPEKDFKAGAKLSTVASFELQIPGSLIHPIKIRLSAKTGEFADGEEHIIPVLTKEILVKENQPVILKGMDTTITKPGSINRVYGLELSMQEKPQAALLNSLPFLANYSYNCAEQILNKMYAHVIALTLMRKDSTLGNLYEKTVAAANKNDKTSIDPLTSETMPWLDLGSRKAKEKRELMEILDTFKCKDRIKDLLSKLMVYQNRDGGICWFPGGNSNARVSFYLLARLGNIMHNDSWYPVSNQYVDLGPFIEKLIYYSDHELFQLEKIPFNQFLYYSYARSFWKKLYPLNDTLESRIKSKLIKSLDEPEAISLREQALHCLSSLRYSGKTDSLYKNAISGLNSIKQQAIENAEHGIRWKEMADGEDIGSSGEETLSYLLEAFHEAGEGSKIEAGVIQWLLTCRQEHQWKTTTGTAASIAVLLRSKKSVAGHIDSLYVVLPDTSLFISDDLLAAKRIAFLQTDRISSFKMHRISDEPVNANLGWYYFIAADSVFKVNKEVHIQKSLSRLDEKNKEWQSVIDTTKLILGEKIKVTLTIETPRTLRFVFIEDKKAAAFEPLAYKSGNIKGSEFSYYESVRDAGRQFFAEVIPAGKSHINYEMVVSQEGRFSSGITCLQCMYKPEISAFGIPYIISVVK